ncbi:hypothetical protein AB1Y20_013222 [Prymnesium parvum]|uniref:Uncharacterized protein n=1 Tax=Prymnesium parvum TaxID=97485 RepID=A0AB34IMX6_PRYPA
MACEAWCNSFICNHAGCEGCAGANGCYTPPAPPASPPPPPWAPGMCSRTYQACLDGGQCCVSPSDACYLRRGKRFAMCRPLPRDGHCVSDDRWLCPKPRAELAGAVPGTDGMQQFAPTPPPPRPPPPPPCGKPFTQCWDGIGAPRECCGEHFHCYRSHGKKFALCRPYTEDCGEQWLQKKNKQNLPYMDCLDWLVSPPGFPTPRAPPGLPPSPRWPVPSPPPLPPCSASWAACWDAPHERIGCCADPKQACFRREGKRFAMCRPLILDPLHGGCIPAEGWDPIVATSPLATRTPTPAQLAHLERAVVNPTCPGTYKQSLAAC